MPAGQGTSSPQSSAPADAPTYGTPGSTAPGADSIFGAYGISADAAGENIGGTNVTDEPYGPNSTLGTNGSGDQLYPGPGNNSFIDRPPVLHQPSHADSGGLRARHRPGWFGHQPGSPHRHRHRRRWVEHHHLSHTRQRQPVPGR